MWGWRCAWVLDSEGGGSRDFGEERQILEWGGGGGGGGGRDERE